jgi:hypothetical protein
MVITLCDLVKLPWHFNVIQYCVQLVSLWLLYTSIVIPWEISCPMHRISVYCGCTSLVTLLRNCTLNTRKKLIIRSLLGFVKNKVMLTALSYTFYYSLFRWELLFPLWDYCTHPYGVLHWTKPEFMRARRRLKPSHAWLGILTLVEGSGWGVMSPTRNTS